MVKKEPVLIVMAAGMGSRYGGLKQLDPVGPAGEILLDYSVYDARRAGFRQVIFIIRREFEAQFDDLVKRKLAGRMDYRYAYQDLQDLPEGFALPEGRVKPWGTGQAVLAARDLIEGPVAVINADDYYGPSAYRAIQAFLKEEAEGPLPRVGLCVWRLGDTLSDHGYVSRGVCRVDEDGRLTRIDEIKRIEREGKGGRYSLDGGKSYQALDGDLPVSMNFWGFPESFISLIKEDFPAFLEEAARTDPLTAEYLLPEIVGQRLAAGRIEAVTRPVTDPWYGVTNREDRPRVAAALAGLTEEGLYPCPLWP